MFTNPEVRNGTTVLTDLLPVLPHPAVLFDFNSHYIDSSGQVVTLTEDNYMNGHTAVTCYLSDCYSVT